MIYNTDRFIDKAKQIHGDRYCYDMVEYVDAHTKVKIICSVHGVFEQKPNGHLNGHGCRPCGYDIVGGDKRLKSSDVIYKFRQTHDDRYNYSLVEYKNKKTKVKIICSVHGVFEQTPKNHLNGQGCYECGRLLISQKQSMGIEEFISKAKHIHGDKYCYDMVEYINNSNKVKIICSVHGVFEQKPNGHLNGHGCSVCAKTISRQELDLLDYIKSIYKGKIVTNTRKVISPYELDIYLPDIQKAFEYNGMYWHTEGLNKPIGYHQMKNDLCAHRGINLTHIWEHDWMNDNRFMKEVIKRGINCG